MAYPRIQWSDDMVETLVAMRATGATIGRCADRIGVCYPVAAEKARALGVNARLSVGRMSGEKAHRLSRRRFSHA